jgi:hypothetical protein
MRFFNNAGPCDPERDYMLPPEPRLPGARNLVDRGRYFVVHAPRQTGKTTTLTALAQDITAEGRQAAVLFSCERARTYANDIGAAGREILQAITSAAEDQGLPAECLPPPWPDVPPGSLLQEGLRVWARSCPRPLVLFFDEFDSLSGPALLSVASQLRDGFRSRPRNFPASVALCGLRDIRDYRIAAGQSPEPSGRSNSPFNIIYKSFRMHDFTRDKVAKLYGQHTAETGQEFTAEAVDRAFGYSQGQPWLVNTLALQIVDEDEMGVAGAITVAHVDEAKERLILTRATHIEYLADKLAESRVQRFIEPLLAGTSLETGGSYNDDLQYVRDLGLIATTDPVRVANPIYREVIARTLAFPIASQVTEKPSRFVLPDGRLDFPLLLEAFTDFWVDIGAEMASKEKYHEVSTQVVFMGFLQRIVNGGGFVDREYALGTGRTDILVRKPYGHGQVQREYIELKVWLPKKGDPLDAGLRQLDSYLSTARLNVGTLVIFDRRDNALPVAERTEITHLASPAGNAVTLLRA